MCISICVIAIYVHETIVYSVTDIYMQYNVQCIGGSVMVTISDIIEYACILSLIHI